MLIRLVFCYVLSWFLHEFADAQYPRGLYAFSLLAENYIEIKTAGAPAKKISFSIAYGDWYALSDDASATIIFEFKQNDKEYILEVSWDGTERSQKLIHYPVVNPSRNFIYYESDKNGAGFSVSPYDEDDEAEIIIRQMDESTLIASISGHVKSNLREAGSKGFVSAEISGHISLRKNTNDRVVTSRFGDCDPVVHNKVPGGLSRSASDCEKKFVAFADSVIEQAFEPVRAYFYERGWKEISLSDKKLDMLPWAEEKKFISLSWGSPHSVRLMKNLEAETVTGDRMLELNDSLEQVAKDKGVEPDMGAIIRLSTEIMDEEDRKGWARIAFAINGNGDYLYRGQVKEMQKSGVNFVVQAGTKSDEQGGEGLPSGLHPGETFVGVGNWKPVVIKSYDEKTMELILRTKYNVSDPHLSFQSMLVHIESNKEWSDKIMELMDWEKLVSLFKR